MPCCRKASCAWSSTIGAARLDSTGRRAIRTGSPASPIWKPWFARCAGADWPEQARGIFQGFRSPKGEDLILNRNLFIEGVLPNAVMRGLSDAEMAVYRKPYIDGGEVRRPMLTWPRQIPIDGEPAEVVAIAEAYGAAMKESPIPKLFVNGKAGLAS